LLPQGLETRHGQIFPQSHKPARSSLAATNLTPGEAEIQLVLPRGWLPDANMFWKKSGWKNSPGSNFLNFWKWTKISFQIDT
jgi:hypothetical protein